MMNQAFLDREARESKPIIKRLRKYKKETGATNQEMSNGAMVSLFSMGRWLSGDHNISRMARVRCDEFLKKKGY